MLRNWRDGLLWLVCGVFAVSVLQFLWLVLHRITYPYQIEWIEGGLLQQVLRVLQGKPLYAMPSLEYTPSLYMPLYFYLSAFAGQFFGGNFFSMRLVSVLAAVFAALTCGVTVRMMTGRRLGFFLGFAGFFVAYPFSGYWFDVGRVDTLWAMWLALAVCCLVWARQSDSAYPLFLSSMSLLLAFFTKQSSLFVFPFFFLSAIFWFGVKRAMVCVAFSMVLLVAVLSLLSWYWGDVFFYLVMEMAGSHDMSISRIRLFLLSDLLLAVPAFFVLSLSWLYFNRHSSAGFSGWLSLFVGFLLMSAVSRIYAGGAVNVLMPTYFLMIMLSAAACLHMAGSGGRKFSVIAAVLMLVLNAVHGWQWHALQKLIPSSLDRLAGDALVERIRQVPGRVCASKDGYLAYLAGKEFCAHNALLADVMNGGDKHIAGMLAADARDKIMSGYYEVIILNNPTELTGYGLDRQALPYTATLIDYSFPPLDGKQFFPVSGGPRPGSWLQYNGDKWVDERPVLPPVE